MGVSASEIESEPSWKLDTLKAIIEDIVNYEPFFFLKLEDAGVILGRFNYILLQDSSLQFRIDGFTAVS